MNAEELAKLLDTLTTRLQGPAQQVFELTYRFVVTDAILGLIFGTILILMTIPCWVFVIHRRRAYRTAERYDQVDHVLGAIVGTIIGSIVLLIGLTFLFINLTTLLNPEYRTLEKLLENLPR